MQTLKGVLVESPLVSLSIITCLWLFIRAIIYQMKLASGRPSLLELTLVALSGIVAALFRDKEQAWYLSLFTIALNTAAWWYAVSQLEWGYLYES